MKGASSVIDFEKRNVTNVCRKDPSFTSSLFIQSLKINLPDGCQQYCQGHMNYDCHQNQKPWTSRQGLDPHRFLSNLRLEGSLKILKVVYQAS